MSDGARFIDMHHHGAGGVAYDDDVDLTPALEVHRRHGTKWSVLSLVSAPIERTERRLRAIAEVTRRDPGVLGSHLEGPFLAPSRKGAHDVSALAVPTPELVDRHLAAADGTLRMVTLAPELPGSADAQRRYLDAGVVVAIGHTEADYDTCRAAFDAGATVLTHAFNGMPDILHRQPGPVMAAIDSGAVLEVIADGVHIHPSLVRMLFSLAPDRIALVTDAMSATGCPDGTYDLGGLGVDVRDGIARLAGTETLAGSTLTLDQAVANAVAWGVPEDAARAAVTATPARVLGLPFP